MVNILFINHFTIVKGTKNQRGADIEGKQASQDPVQLYDTVGDISETKNVAALHPEIVARLQTAYDNHVKEISANKRPTAEMIRPEGAISPERPGGSRKKKKTPKK